MKGRWILLGDLTFLLSQLWEQGHCHGDFIMKQTSLLSGSRRFSTHHSLFSGGAQLLLAPTHQTVIDLMDMLVIGLLQSHWLLLTCGDLGRAGVARVRQRCGGR